MMLPRSRVVRAVLALVALALATVVGLAAWLGRAPVAWSVRATVAGGDDATAWRHVPASWPVVAACDVQALLSSPIARQERPRLAALAARHGFDLALAERNVRLLVVAGGARDPAFREGEDAVLGVASGFRASPLLIARFNDRWKVSTLPEDAARHLESTTVASDGRALLVPLEPGIVGWLPSAAENEARVRILQAATASPREPLAMEGAALRVVAELDDGLRADAAARVAKEARPLVTALVRLDARIDAGDELSLRLALDHRDESSAAATAALLQQLDMAATLARGAGSLAALLGKDALLLTQLPPLKVSREGSQVIVLASADRRQVDGWLDLAQSELGW